MRAEEIASVSIHPSIGIARVGNAPDAWFLAPEVVGGVPEAAEGYRDAEGRLKRQVARFRVYATLKSGEVREVTANTGVVTWRVEVANLKAGWYNFLFPMDLDPAYVVAPARRNAMVTGAERERLDIRPSPKRISGIDQQGPGYRFDDGTFYGKPVYLGELRTDEAGRLLVFGGRGFSAPKVEKTLATTFANNDDWHDDVCDGVVRAQIVIDDRSFEATPAHVVVTPPNYGPGLFGVTTMDDVVRDLYIREGWLETPVETSFSADIWPLFDRLTGHQWVNDGVLLIAGQGTALDARAPDVIARLADPSPASAPFRQAVLRFFRPQPLSDDPAALPPFYGDTTDDNVDPTREYLTITPTQYAHLERWAAGTFTSDWVGFPRLPRFEDLPPIRQIEELDRAGLHECLGGPFHPGIEVTWPFRLASMWEAPYRLRTLPEGVPTPQDYGPELTRDMAVSPTGPHGASGPGSLTRWLGVPWQTDEASCNSGALYTPSLYLSVPSFWGARVPNQVLPSEAFQVALLPEQSDLQRQRHFSLRRDWLRDIKGLTGQQRINNMVAAWWKIGLVEAKSPPAGSGLPDPCFVETGRAPEFTKGDFTKTMAIEAAGLQVDQPVVKAKLLTTVPKAEKSTYQRFRRGEV